MPKQQVIQNVFLRSVLFKIKQVINDTGKPQIQPNTNNTDQGYGDSAIPENSGEKGARPASQQVPATVCRLYTSLGENECEHPSSTNHNHIQRHFSINIDMRTGKYGEPD